MPDAAIEAVRAWLAEKTLVVAGERLEVTGSRPRGHVAAVHAQAKALRRPEIGLHVPVEDPLAETIGRAAEGSGSSRLPFDGYRKMRIRRAPGR